MYMKSSKLVMMALCMSFMVSFTVAQNVANQRCNLSVKVADSLQGTVAGGGKYSPFQTTVITAFPKKDHRFSHWSDGSQENPRTITVKSDTTMTAHFSYTGCEVKINITPKGAGTVTGAGRYSPGDSVIIVARPNPGYSFACSKDSSKIVHTFIARYNTTYNLTAKFSKSGATITSNTDIDQEVSLNRDINLYPNPVETELTVSGTYMYKIDLYMVGGQLVNSYPNVNGRIFNIDVRKLPSGSYYLNVETARGMFTRKFIKR